MARGRRTQHDALGAWTSSILTDADSSRDSSTMRALVHGTGARTGFCLRGVAGQRLQTEILGVALR